MLRQLIIITIPLIAMLANTALAANGTTEKTDCKLAIGYDSMDDLKADLLLSAKRLAVNELFGELITAATAVDDFVVTSDQIRASSLGLVREDALRYYNGDNLGEVCVTISVYTTDEDRKQFAPVKLNKRNCVSNPDMTARELRQFAEEEVIVKAILEYNRKLEGQKRDNLLKLLQRVTYLESGMLPDTDSYCVRVEGYLLPIEVMTIIETSQPVSPVVANTEQPRATYVLSFRGIDQNDWDTYDSYALIVNDGTPVVFDELTHAQSNGERREDWEQYVFPIKLIPGQENVITMSVTS